MSHYFIKSEEIRQWSYCPNILFHRKFGIRYKGQTMKMKLGAMIHNSNAIHHLWKEIGFKGDIKTNEKLIDNKNNLVAQIDIIYYYPENKKDILILEIKTGKKVDHIQSHHLQQLSFQAYVAENVLESTVKEIGAYYLKSNKVIKQEYTPGLKISIENTIRSIKGMYSSQIKPYVPYTNKCTICEYKNQCWG